MSKSLYPGAVATCPRRAGQQSHAFPASVGTRRRMCNAKNIDGEFYGKKPFLRAPKNRGGRGGGKGRRKGASLRLMWRLCEWAGLQGRDCAALKGWEKLGTQYSRGLDSITHHTKCSLIMASITSDGAGNVTTTRPPSPPVLWLPPLVWGLPHAAVSRRLHWGRAVHEWCATGRKSAPSPPPRASCVGSTVLHEPPPRPTCK